MKKALFLFLAVALLLGSPVMAAANDPSANQAHGKNAPHLQMTTEQKNQMIALKTQMLELKKQIIKYNLEQGLITSQQAQKMEDRLNARLEALKSGKLEKGRRHHAPQLQPKA